ncbi:MAG: thiamine pyrophosphate-dependent enzyme [Mycobacterium sp.]
MPYFAADYVIERLMQQNVEALFGVPAVYGAALFAAAARASTPARPFRTVVNSSDLESGYAADGYARVRGLSAVSVSYGVGTLSLVNAVAGAYIERSPVVVLNGGPSQTNIDDQNRTGVLFSHSMGRPHSDMEAFAPFTALCERADTEAAVPALIDRALTTALTRKHPVYVEVPQAWWSRPCSPPAGTLDLSLPAGSADAAAQSVLQAIAAASNPMVIVGVEIARYRLADTMLSILNRLNLPWATTVLSKSVLPEQHPKFLGVFNGERSPAALKSKIQTSDLIIALGAVFGSGHASMMIPKFDKTIRIWDGALVNRGGAPQPMHTPPFVAALDAAGIVRRPVGFVGRAPAAAEHFDEHGESAWDGDRGAEIALAAAEPAASPTPIATGLTYQELFDTLAEPAFWDTSLSLIADTYLGIYPAARMTMPAQNSFMADAIWASIGHSVAAAVGAAIPGEKRPVVVCGDGGFQMTGQALATMVRMRQNTIVIVVDNGLYGYEQYLLGRSYYNSQTEAPLPYAVLAPCDYEGFARAMGVGQVSGADSVATLRTALASAKAHSTGPSFIHALVKSRSLPPGL